LLSEKEEQEVFADADAVNKESTDDNRRMESESGEESKEVLRTRRVGELKVSEVSVVPVGSVSKRLHASALLLVLVFLLKFCLMGIQPRSKPRARPTDGKSWQLILV